MFLSRGNLNVSVSRFIKSRHWVIVIALVLAIIAASRIINLLSFEMDVDETWSIWQTFGTPAQIVQWTPYNWSPAYYLFVGAWKELVGLHPFVLRYSSVLFFLIGLAFLYSAMRMHQDRVTALGIMILYA